MIFGSSKNQKWDTFSEFMKRLRRTRSKSAPGPNGVPYIIYKRCHGVARQLWSYLRGMWKENSISNTWRKAEGILIPKVDGATLVDKFRTISLLNVEGKIYFAMRADRLLKFVQDNKYIDSSIQKGSHFGMSRAHRRVVTTHQGGKSREKEPGHHLAGHR